MVNTTACHHPVGRSLGMPPVYRSEAPARSKSQELSRAHRIMIVRRPLALLKRASPSSLDIQTVVIAIKMRQRSCIFCIGRGITVHKIILPMNLRLSHLEVPAEEPGCALERWDTRSLLAAIIHSMPAAESCGRRTSAAA